MRRDGGRDFAAFEVDAACKAVGGDPMVVRSSARRPDTIVGFGKTGIQAETATLELRASEVASPRPGDHVAVGGQNLVVRNEPEGGRNWRTFDPNAWETYLGTKY